MRGVIGAVSGIGEIRFNQIIDAIKEHYRIDCEKNAE